MANLTHEQVLKSAMKRPLCNYSFVQLNNNISAIDMTSAFYYLTSRYYEDKESAGKIVGEEALKDRILAHVDSITTGGNEPDFNYSQNWSYPPLVAALCILKKTDLWNAISQEKRNKIHCLMKCFAYLMNYAYNVDNNYATGLKHNYKGGKRWAPNMELAILSYVYIIEDYFEGNLDELFVTFDYDAFVFDLNLYGFTNALSSFAAEAKDFSEYGFVIPSAKDILLGNETQQYHIDPMTGNVTYGGKGKGINRKFEINSYLIGEQHIKIYPTDNFALINFLVERVYSNIAKSNIYFDEELVAFILEPNVVSPYENQKGMIFEMNNDWTSGKKRGRSCVKHSTIDYALCICMFDALKLLGIYDIAKHTSLYNQVNVGNKDLEFKLQNGYRSYNGGASTNEYESEYAGYYFWKDIWANIK